MTTLHLSWPRGDKRAPVFTVLDGDGNAVDLSAASLGFTVRKVSDDSVLAALSSPTAITVGGASNNEVTVAVAAGLTKDWPVGRWTCKYDLVAFPGTNDVTIAGGCITILEDQTRTE